MLSRNRTVVLSGKVLGLLLPVFAVGCSAGSSSQSTDACANEQVDALKELFIVDDDVVDDARAKNATAGPWSFRYAVENMIAPGADPGDFVREWLLDWVLTRDLGGVPLDSPGEERDAKMRSIVICPWLKRTPENGCDAACNSCTGQKLDMALAPFRLIAITNRMDLREQLANSPNGEGRLVFGLFNGAADDASATALPMTVIFEYRLPDTRPVADWAKDWHALGSFPERNEDYRVALQALTDRFVKRGSQPGAVNGSAIGQVRTNESALDWIWQQRQFRLDESGKLLLAPVRNTPAAAFNSSPALVQWVSSSRDAILKNKYEMPASLAAGSADTFIYTWNVPTVDQQTRNAFAAGTCNGCHGAEHVARDGAFHISPFRRGTEKLSPFIHDPSGTTEDEFVTRTASLRRALCSN